MTLAVPNAHHEGPDHTRHADPQLPGQDKHEQRARAWTQRDTGDQREAIPKAADPCGLFDGRTMSMAAVGAVDVVVVIMVVVMMMMVARMTVARRCSPSLRIRHRHLPQPADPAPHQPQPQPGDHRMADRGDPILGRRLDRPARQAKDRYQRIDQPDRHRRLCQA